MKKLKKIKLRPFLMAAFLLAILFSLGSCEEVVYYGDLEVLITGTFSGNPREDIAVTLYLTEADANDEVNPYTTTEFTDADGYAIFYDLEGGNRYWVRAEEVLTYIKRTQTIKEGYNLFEFTVI